MSPKNKQKRVVSDLPGRPMVRDFCGPQGAIDPKWIIRDASGEILSLETWLCGQYISAMARGCLDMNIRRVVFIQPDDSFATRCALAVIPTADMPFRKLTGQEFFTLLALKKLYGLKTARRETFTPDLSSDGAILGDNFDDSSPFPNRERARTVARAITEVYRLDADVVQSRGGAFRMR